MQHHSIQKHVLCLLQLQLQLPLPVGHGACRAKEGQGGEAVHRRHSGAVHRPEQGLCLHLEWSYQVIPALFSSYVGGLVSAVPGQCLECWRQC